MGITTHHDGHGLNERITIEPMDEPEYGANHEYHFSAERDGQQLPVGFLFFQKGPRNDPAATPGVTEAALISVLIHRLQGMNSALPNRYTALAITELEKARNWLRNRADERAAAGTLGTSRP